MFLNLIIIILIIIIFFIYVWVIVALIIMHHLLIIFVQCFFAEIVREVFFRYVCQNGLEPFLSILSKFVFTFYYLRPYVYCYLLFMYQCFLYVFQVGEVFEGIKGLDSDIFPFTFNLFQIFLKHLFKAQFFPISFPICIFLALV